PGYFYEPTVLTDYAMDSRVNLEETFGRSHRSSASKTMRPPGPASTPAALVWCRLSLPGTWTAPGTGANNWRRESPWSMILPITGRCIFRSAAVPVPTAGLDASADGTRWNS